MDKLGVHIEAKHVKNALPKMKKTYESEMDFHFMDLVKYKRRRNESNSN